MIKIALCDDDPAQSRYNYGIISKYADAKPEAQIVISRFTSPCEMLNNIESGNRYDIYILDVIMPVLNGIEVGRQIRRLDAFAAIIYMTGSPDFALDSYSVEALDYIVKPIDPQKLFCSLDRAVARAIADENRRIPVKTKDGVTAVLICKISAIEYKNHSLEYYLDDGSRILAVSRREPFAVQAERVLADERFVRPHASFAVNMDKAETITDRCFVMQNGMEIPISQKCYSDVRRRYFEHLLKA